MCPAAYCNRMMETSAPSSDLFGTAGFSLGNSPADADSVKGNWTGELLPKPQTPESLQARKPIALYEPESPPKKTNPQGNNRPKTQKCP